ncbi:MAG: PAS domain-containing protein [Kiritimatiellae bacterium]|nr:PAS domain-containing protein [Kiritimatiellia bacterium]
MRKRHLIWHIYPYSLLIIIACICAFGGYFLRSLKEFNYSQTENELRVAATIMANQLAPNASQLESEETNLACKELSATAGCRFTIVLPSGKVIADSEKDAGIMDNHANRPEIKQAQINKFGSNKRYSQTLRMDMLYVAVPITYNSKNIGTIRASISLSKANTAIKEMWYKLVVAAIIISLLAAIATLLATRRIRKQLGDISLRAKDFGAGNFNTKLPSSSITEVDLLASNMNSMSEQLKRRINTIVKQRDEQNVLLSCMAESVIAVDNDEKIIRVNQAAKKLFNINGDDACGKPISEVIRHSDLLNIIDKTLANTEFTEGDIFLADIDKHLQAHGSIIHDNKDKQIGAVIVLNDISKLIKLETMRKDFVANVSHELKTPITSIKGFIDTLLDSEVEDKADQERFMQIIRTQANRLQSIIDDLLTLSSIEHGLEDKNIILENANIDSMLKNAIQTCSTIATSKNIKINLATDKNITANINPQLLEQAVTNLIDNAIKYSDRDTSIDITTEITDHYLAIHVNDQGPGIAEKHLKQLFQRFYRVDKSRSRKSGGTGLGLAIVKHIALSHNGRVEVQSKLGEGSTFSILIPQN